MSLMRMKADYLLDSADCQLCASLSNLLRFGGILCQVSRSSALNQNRLLSRTDYLISPLQQNSSSRSDLCTSAGRTAPHQCQWNSLLSRTRPRILVDPNLLPSRPLCSFPSIDSSSGKLQTPSTISPLCSSPLPSPSTHSLRRTERLSLPR